MEEEPQNQDLDLIPSAPQVTIQSPPPIAAEPTQSEEGDYFPLDDDLVMDVYNLSFDEFQKRIVKS